MVAPAAGSTASLVSTLGSASFVGAPAAAQATTTSMLAQNAHPGSSSAG
jgi:hypothetical protein